MSKIHIVNVSIANNTPGDLKYNSAYFKSGSLADGQTWPQIIACGTEGSAQCSEGNQPHTGCSGWVEYTYDGSSIYFCFSNPETGSNGIHVATTSQAWEEMGNHDYPITLALPLHGSNWLTAKIFSTSGQVNQASWTVQVCDVDNLQPANLELSNVPQVWAELPVDGTRTYYRCPGLPSGVRPISLPFSHFKGIASYGSKLIFTHTNIHVVLPENGKYMIADKIPIDKSQGYVDHIYDTSPAHWPHPCSVQACGSFMAMGIQKDASGPGSMVSQIQILDIRNTQVNLPFTIIGTIERPDDGINGVAMTKESGPAGRYIVAGINGQNLTLYRSNTSTLLNEVPSFEQIGDVITIEDSGPGLALVTQQGDGAIYLFAMNTTNGWLGNTLTLYKVINWPTPSVSCVPVGRSKHMNIPGMSD